MNGNFYLKDKMQRFSNSIQLFINLDIQSFVIWWLWSQVKHTVLLENLILIDNITQTKEGEAESELFLPNTSSNFHVR
jgi:hypothetical protein